MNHSLLKTQACHFSLYLFFWSFFAFYLLFFNPTRLVAQDLEIKSNGLIYDSVTVSQLRLIVDSLNLKFKQCDLHKVYYALPQSPVWSATVKLPDNQMEALFAYLNQNPAPTPAQVKAKYGKWLEGEKNQIAVRYLDDINGKEVEVVALKPDEAESTIFYDDDLFKNGKTSQQWIDLGQVIYYFEKDLLRSPLSKEFARMVQYADCLIDTNSSIYLPGAKSSWEERRAPFPEMDTLKAYVKWQDHKMVEGDYNTYRAKVDSEYQRIQKEFGQDTLFKKLLINAKNAALKRGGEYSFLESLAEKNLSVSDKLDIKRSYRVFGSCSMDSAPREHAQDIAALAAESRRWEVFLRAHLNIMNDRFERSAYSSYGEATFGTYIRELEALDINVQDLLFGISFRIDNPSENHYYASIQRLGRAFVESKEVDQFEQRTYQYLTSKELDNYNKLMVYYLYLNFIYRQNDAKQVQAKLEAFQKRMSDLPLFLQSDLKTRTVSE